MAHKDTIAAASILEIKDKFEVATTTKHKAGMSSMQQERTMLLNKIAQLRAELEKFPGAEHLPNRKRKHVTTSTLPSALSGMRKTLYNIEREQPNQTTYTQFSCDHCNFRAYNHFSVRKHLSLKHM